MRKFTLNPSCVTFWFLALAPALKIAPQRELLYISCTAEYRNPYQQNRFDDYDSAFHDCWL
jgi:hypothetical protein